MQLKYGKTTAAIIVVFLLLASMTFITIVQAQESGIHGGVGNIGTSPTNVYGYPTLGDLPPGVTPDFTFDKIAFLSFRPNPIGIGQSLLVNIWTTPGVYHAFYMHGYKVTIEKPDGTTDDVTLNSYVADCTAWFEYVPTTPGSYRLKFESPGTYIPAGVYVDRPGVLTSPNYTMPHSIYYKSASTDWQNLTVQADFVPSWPPSPLPTDYWTRPVNLINREWSPILGGYPFTGNVYYYPNGRILYGQDYYHYTAFVQAPNSAHVVWRKLGDPATMSGLIGGEAYDYAITSTPGTPDIILDGRCYDSVTKIVDGQQTNVWQCYDLRTGEIFWERTGISQVPNLIEYSPPTPDPTVAGATAARSWSVSLMYIASGRLVKYNPATGATTVNVSIAPLSSATYYMPEYALSIQSMGGGNYRLINWTTAGNTATLANRIKGNISWPRSSLSTAGCVDYDAGIATTIGPNSLFETEMGISAGIEWNIGHIMQSVDLYTGEILFEGNTNDTLTQTAQGQNRVADRGKVALGVQGMHINCYDARTGKQLWTSEQENYPWGNWHAYNGPTTYDFNESKGAIIDTTYDGIYAIDWDDGHIIWHFRDPSVPFEGPYGDTPFFTTVQIADGKIYAYNGEHTPSLPNDRGWSLYCINATNGELIWKILNPMAPGAIGDGYLTAGNPYDGYMYVFGRGQSATTVTAEPAVIANGDSVLIKGTVLDISPAQPSTPCVSAASMETQMEYLHMQMPIDGLWHNLTITGVPVILTAIGSDDSVYDLGTVTTNGYYGTFAMTWTPPKEDTYTIIASFEADDSYGSSSAATAVGVGPAVETPATPEIPTPTDYTPLLYGIIAAVIVAIIIGIVAILVTLRKR
jgi:hypothetical protein